MARMFSLSDAKQLGLPGRKSLEIVSGEKGARGITLRLVEIAPPRLSEPLRSPHQHSNFEECIYVLSGQGTTVADNGEFLLKAGDTLLIPPGEKHVTRNTGSDPLLLLCFFPVGDIAEGAVEPGVASGNSSKS
jgi:quercetin dioxygenase-like cupin family protein